MNSKRRFSFAFFIFSCQIAFSQQSSAGGEFKLFFEKVYLHLDRTYYAPGDDIWFKAYLVNAQNNLLFKTSNNLYVELIDPANAILSRRVIRLDSMGIGDFHLNDSLPGGVYRVRAYTNWMRNFGNHFIFEKEIYVTEIPQLRKTSSAQKTAMSRNKPITTEASFKIQFLPEGGYLLADVPAKVAFKTEDVNGKGVQSKGFITSLSGDTIIAFKTAYRGMGSFAFTPKKDTGYRAFIQYGSGKFNEVKLPETMQTGYVMSVRNTDADTITVSIKTNEATTKQFPNGIVNLAARHAGKSYFKQQVNLKKGEVVVTISKKDFPGGIASITLYDETMRPHCERLVYIDESNEAGLKLSVDKALYRSREKTTISIAVTDAGGKPVKAFLSLAAVEEGSDPVTVSNISSYLMLESELTGKIENAFSYFDPTNPDRLHQLDLLLLTQGWRSFLWRQLADTTIRISYLPEAGITISGNVIKPFTNKPLDNMNITLFAPDAKGDKIYLTKTNAQGKYYLDGLPLYGIQNIKLNVGDGMGKRIGEIKMDTLFGNPVPVTRQPVYQIDSSSFTSFEKLATSRWSKFRANQWSHILPNITVTANKGTTLLRDGSVAVNFGYPEYNFNITNEDYGYPRLRDFIIQKVPGARYDDDLEGVYFLSNGRPVRPILIVNGQQDVFDRLDYYSLSMRQIEKVYIRHMVGSPTYNGIDNLGNEIDIENFRLPAGIRDYFLVSLVVKPGNANQQLSKLTASVDGYYDARIFYAPNYSNDNPVEEDQRITIHWAPSIKTDNEGRAVLSFYNADSKAKIRINVQGLTINGAPVTGISSYEIK